MAVAAGQTLKGGAEAAGHLVADGAQLGKNVAVGTKDVLASGAKATVQGVAGGAGYLAGETANIGSAFADGARATNAPRRVNVYRMHAPAGLTSRASGAKSASGVASARSRDAVDSAQPSTFRTRQVFDAGDFPSANEGGSKRQQVVQAKLPSWAGGGKRQTERQTDDRKAGVRSRFAFTKTQEPRQQRQNEDKPSGFSFFKKPAPAPKVKVEEKKQGFSFFKKPAPAAKADEDKKKEGFSFFKRAQPATQPRKEDKKQEGFSLFKRAQPEQPRQSDKQEKGRLTFWATPQKQPEPARQEPKSWYSLFPKSDKKEQTGAHAGARNAVAEVDQALADLKSERQVRANRRNAVAEVDQALADLKAQKKF
ncbi:hypothetical protein GNI_004810 [Gregarina niphandrodes]|uniref:Uncharacterized protein n=1 Tax=Gregarina niphandrodes TaxID=110365 RepID=A0A023BDK5_GRENI|nr:hypothetical protein GNI_004810 [Gregarina niphandrodes]EZG88401.1 hypothetical protein GNI_004810 [Gregarina niphandrodes]|eukprot:XP_011128575.1 hypothetical protein GNI_004810 [Gregarina niphandrodes]